MTAMVFNVYFSIIIFLFQTIYLVSNGQDPIVCKMLDCDIISQAKEKALDALFLNTPLSSRPYVQDVDLGKIFENTQIIFVHIIFWHKKFITSSNIITSSSADLNNFLWQFHYFEYKIRFRSNTNIVKNKFIKIISHDTYINIHVF